MTNISVVEVKERMANNEHINLLDVREPDERVEFNIGGAFIPVGQVLMMQTDEIADWKDKEVICYCRSGKRSMQAAMMLEVEVDTLIQLDAVLPTAPDIILLDNMKIKQLREAVFRRNMSSVPTELEASGGVNLETVRAIAETGVERISVGALTHSAVCLDVALDWEI